MKNDWKEQFRAVYQLGVAAWKGGRRTPSTMFGKEEAPFLASIGCTAQELFDFVDDGQRYGEPDYDTTLAVTEIRRQYFLDELHSQRAGKIRRMEDFPAKSAEVDGIAWLPRLIEKGRAKLRGEMPDDLMFGCGGDRAFFQQFHMKPAEFLKLTWESGSDDRRIIDAVKKAAGRK
jgi:hypothetical protein